VHLRREVLGGILSGEVLFFGRAVRAGGSARRCGGPRLELAGTVALAVGEQSWRLWPFGEVLGRF
jgi:hypothetical protein